MLESENLLVKRIANRVRRDKNNKWNKTMTEYMSEIGMKDEEWEEMSKDDIKKRVREFDNKRWSENLEGKTTLEVYRKYIKKIVKEIFLEYLCPQTNITLYLINIFPITWVSCKVSCILPFFLETDHCQDYDILHDARSQYG